ncbi:MULTISPECIES: lytic polysaccharide monooxygenase auxiliary activity family 9 protein [Actinomadura]|uniref:Chitin-binding protein n=1 Tax=Actinomadura litoris TaxID=2678616 RepID=A0A7K1L2D2_9ACTN|nr:MULTISPECIES: lytic polysaccharide monooxygenase auxiliary activity family 9 protein [Actinomadura]MBT2208832.1 lytic polysaccharide monooxygenase [Actinomadura sp. NEAU-AAG7]MUN38608.1 chitin-binding protein [Actinomadura litoris]
MKKRLIAAASSVALTPAILVALPGTASAHGYVNAPPSRQAQCAARTVQCGSIKYEPQSVEGPKGQRSCNGGNGAFAELNDDSKGWKAASVGRSATFTWKFTARHRTTNWEYYIGGTRVGNVSGNNAQPPETVSHNINLGNFSGRQKVLAIWNIADTGNAFYACIDVQIG